MLIFLGNCVRVITRTVDRIAEETNDAAGKIRNRGRSIKKKILAIVKISKRRTEEKFDGKKLGEWDLLNYGFLIKDVNESDPNQWTTFYSSDASSPNKPELIINYTKEAEIRTKDARIYYDASCTESASTLATYFNSATQEIKNTFNIEFKLAYVTFSSLLDGSSCSKTICDSSCGALSSCSTLHHKGAGRLIDLLKSSSYYTYRLVGHRLCYYNSSHGEIIGLGYCPGRDSITSLVSSPNIPRSIQHELTHNLGASHTTCVEYQDCVLK